VCTDELTAVEACKVNTEGRFPLSVSFIRKRVCAVKAYIKEFSMEQTNAIFMNV
jgi:hypothetical protein